MKRISYKAFTLVELLVVIAIIALLLSILMPALYRVKQQARKVVCKSDMKQLGLALNIYSESNNGALPTEKYIDPSVPYEQYWFNLLFTAMPQLKGMICPSHPWPDRKMGYVVNNNLCGGGYGLNDELDWVSQWAPAATAPHPTMKMAKYKDSSQTVYLLEAGWDMNPRKAQVDWDLICVDSDTFVPRAGVGDGSGYMKTLSNGSMQVDCTRNSGNRNLRADHGTKSLQSKDNVPVTFQGDSIYTIPVLNVLFLDQHVEDITYGKLRDQKGVKLFPDGIKRDYDR